MIKSTPKNLLKVSGANAIATLLYIFDYGQSFQSGVAPALRDSRRSQKRMGCAFA
jgi:hypothetical protein